MANQLQIAVKTYLSKETLLNQAIEKYQIANECGFDNALDLSERVDLISKELADLVLYTSLGLNISKKTFIDAICEYEEQYK